MNAAAFPASLRRAALELHALPEADSRWILASLPAAERKRLEALLSDLRELGIPPEASVLAVQPDADPGLGRIDAANFAALARVLAAEPAGVTRALLALHGPAWRDALLREVNPHRRVELAVVPATARPAPRLEVALLQAVARRLDAEPAMPPKDRWVRLRARWVRFRSAP